MEFNINIINQVLLETNKDIIKKELRDIGRDVAKKTKALIKKSTKVSAPGESPFGKTGTLARSIKVKMKNKGTAVQIVDTARYALSLESGSHGLGSREQEARPYLSKVLQEMQGEIQKRIENAVNLGINFKQVK